MMKKKFLTVAMSVCMAGLCCMTAACQKGGDEGDAAGKTAISVATYNGGIGMDWLKAAAKRFEEKYKDTSFEEGKTGVSIKVSESKTGDMLANTSLDKDVYLTEVVDYYLLQSAGKLADISDIVTGDLSAYGEGEGTIAGKLDSSVNDFLTAKDGKYYGLPFYEGIYGFVYDADMFALKGWYFDESGSFTKTSKSTGMDGVAGTYDDGLPETYAQFQKLIDEIRGDGVTPFVYSTESQTYFVNALANYWADYQGKADMQKNWSLTGETQIISSFDGDTPVLETVTIGNDNVKDLQKQPGKYYALKFLKDVLMSNGENYTSATSFKAAQLELICSCLDGEMQKNPVAMVIDGSWFENEANDSGTFDTAKMLDAGYAGGDYKAMRNFAFMPIPMVDDSETTLNAGSKNENGTHKQTLISANDSFCFVNAGTKGAKLDVAKEFVKFLHTDAELSAFTQTTSVTRPYSYTVSEEAQSGMSHFAKSLMEMKASSDIVYPYSNNAYYVANSSQFLLGQWAWKSNVGTEAINPFVYFHTNSAKTAKEYFEGLYLAH